jgi:acetyltransferase-like isoleucine patch superfamily enzyme
MKILLSLFSEIIIWIELIIMLMPGRLGAVLRRLILRFRIDSLGDSASIGLGFYLKNGKNVIIGEQFSCDRNTFMSADGGLIIIGNHVSLNIGVILNADIGGQISIGNNVLIGPYVVMRTADHNYSSREQLIRSQGHRITNIMIEDDVWIGAGAIILGGSVIRKGSIIGAGSVVKGEVMSYTVAVGSPAKFIKSRA